MFFMQTLADVKRISIAHERTVDSTHKCEFPNGRCQYGLVYCIQGEGEYRFSTGEKCEMREGEVIKSHLYSIGIGCV